MSEWISKIDAYLAGRAVRERILLAAIVLSLIYLLADFVLIKPTYDEFKIAKAKITQAEESIEQIDQTLTITRAKVDAVSLHDNRDLQRIENEIKQVESSLADFTKGFVPANLMASVLEDMLENVSELKLISIKNLPVDDMLASKDGINASDKVVEISEQDGSDKEEKLFRHGVEIQLEGSYVDSRNYIYALESLPWRFEWGLMQFVVKEYPVGTLKLRMHTFSTQRGWLGV